MERIIKPQSLRGNKQIIAGISSRYYGQMKFDGNREKVLRNRQRFFTDLGIAGRGSLVRAVQVHSNRIYRVGGHDLNNNNRFWREIKIKNCDGLMTDLNQVWLAITVADCVPIFIWSGDGEIVAAVHAGWQGTLVKIAQWAVKKITREFDRTPRSLSAYIGPSIGPDHFEVKSNVWNSFKKQFPKEQIFIQKAGRRFINLWQANKNQLVKAGIEEEKIEISQICTVCQQKNLFSFRAGDSTERIMAVIGKNEKNE